LHKAVVTQNKAVVTQSKLGASITVVVGACTILIALDETGRTWVQVQEEDEQRTLILTKLGYIAT
jgi:riboflavin synthase alpha subunit